MTALPKKEPYQKAKICTLHTRLRYNKYWSCHLLFSQHAKLTLAYLITKGILLYVLDVCGKHESTICWILPDGSGNLYINVNKCQSLCCAFCDEILPAKLWDFRILYTLLWAFESTFLIKMCSIKCWKKLLEYVSNKFNYRECDTQKIETNEFRIVLRFMTIVPLTATFLCSLCMEK